MGGPYTGRTVRAARPATRGAAEQSRSTHRQPPMIFSRPRGPPRRNWRRPRRVPRATIATRIDERVGYPESRAFDRRTTSGRPTSPAKSCHGRAGR